MVHVTLTIRFAAVAGSDLVRSLGGLFALLRMTIAKHDDNHENTARQSQEQEMIGGVNLLHFGAGHLEAVRGTRVLHAAHAADQVERIPVDPTFFEECIFDVNGNNFADHKAASRRAGREIDDLMQLAFEAYG